jgi:hypothetical protein
MRKQIQKTQKAIDDWKPRIIDPMEITLGKGTPEQTVDMFFQNYMAKRHALKLIADRDLEEMPELMKKAGVFIDQDETFFVEPKQEE